MDASGRLRHLQHLLAIGVLLVSSALAHAQVREAEWVAPREDITISASEQFQVIGGNAASRGTFASFAERQKAGFLQLLGQQADAWHHPIVLRIQGELTDGPARRPVAWSVNQFGKTFSIQLRVQLGSNFSRDRLQDTLLHLLMFEMALRDVEIKVTDRIIPRWLKEGLPGALRLKNAGRPSAFFKTMFDLNLVTPASEILSASKNDIDSVSRTVFEASASGFVLMLLDQSDGPAKLAKLIHAHGGGHGASGHNLIARHYPEFIGTAERLERQWILYCSKLASPQALEFLDPKATEIQLADALRVSFLEFEPPDPDGETNPDEQAEEEKRGFFRGFLSRTQSPKEKEAEAEARKEDREILAATAEEFPTRTFEGTLLDFERILPRKDRLEILQPVRQRLLNLSFRSFPLHRPLVNDYLIIVGDLMGGKPKNVKKRLDALEEERRRLTELLLGVTAFMDEFEATSLDRKSGVFDAYIERARAIERQSPNPRDPISTYMNEVKQALE